VIVITRNRCRELLHTLHRLQELPDRPPVIVVDNGSNDGTPSVIRSVFPSATVVALGYNAAAARWNIGVRLANTPYVAFCDDDTWWSPGSLGDSARLLSQFSCLAVDTARIVVEPDGHLDPICAEMARSPLPPPQDCPGALYSASSPARR
jgi:N-acetylglucosaminyl-diphospho-decaprenol L-rhamnosyltransferase